MPSTKSVQHFDLDYHVTGRHKVDTDKEFATLSPELGLVPNSSCVIFTVTLNIVQFKTLTTALQSLAKQT